MKIKLTKQALERIAAPVKGRLNVFDTEEPGLAVQVTSDDSRTFYVIKWDPVNHKSKWARLGSLEEMTLDQARTAARAPRSEIREGRDPNATKRESREAATLADVWTAYRSQIKKAPRTLAEDAGLWSRYLEPWAGKRLTDITAAMVQKLYSRIADGEMAREMVDKFGRTRPVKGGPSAARHTVKLLREMFNAMGKTFAMPVNPAAGIHQQREMDCERYIRQEEFAAFWEALEQQDELIRDALKLALFTGQRRANLLAMRWDAVNLDFKTWTIPAAEMKSRRSHTVPLTTQAMEILHRRRAVGRNGEWVLANPDSATGHLVNPEKAIERIWKAAGIPAFSLHDLRRTTGSWLDARESVVAAVLAHRRKGATAVYTRADVDGMRKALQRMADEMTEVTSGNAVSMTARIA